MNTARARLEKHGLTPRKSLGQNFLIDDAAAQRIVEAAGIEPTDTVIEIGPGVGALTQHLLHKAQHVHVIELDQHLIPILHEEFGQFSHLTITHGDALAVDFAQLAQPFSTVRFVANLPYYITSAAIRKMLESRLNVACIVLTIQLEVAQRMVAGVGDMSLLAASVQFYGEPKLLMRLPPAMFYPQPKVESAVVRIVPYGQNPRVNPDAFFQVAKAGFSQPRKQLRNTLASGLNIPKPLADEMLHACEIDPSRRAETLAMHEWVSLAHYWILKRSESLARNSSNNAGESAPSVENSTEP